MNNKVPMVINGNTYGYHYLDNQEFCCTHGGWCSPIEIINETECKMKLVHSGKVMTYRVLNEIPEDRIHE